MHIRPINAYTQPENSHKSNNLNNKLIVIEFTMEYNSSCLNIDEQCYQTAEE